MLLILIKDEAGFKFFFGGLESEANSKSNPIMGVSNIEAKKYPQNPILRCIPKSPMIALKPTIMTALYIMCVSPLGPHILLNCWQKSKHRLQKLFLT
ncbi:hypothetical protein BGP_5199 [Beggiatoa sp. PS]|nr:hypothetical protein BGP_5199 [Beggiatoa sp. PS]